MKIVSLNCPECGGKLDDIKIADGKKDLFCNYCGNHIMLEDENHKVIEHRTVDEYKLRQLEFEKEKYEREERTKKRRIITGIVLVAIGTIITMGSFSSLRENSTPGFIGLILLALGLNCFQHNDNKPDSK